MMLRVSDYCHSTSINSNSDDDHDDVITYPVRIIQILAQNPQASTFHIYVPISSSSQRTLHKPPTDTASTTSTSLIHQLYRQSQLRIGEYASLQLISSSDADADDDRSRRRSRRSRTLVVQLQALDTLNGETDDNFLYMDSLLAINLGYNLAYYDDATITTIGDHRTHTLPTLFRARLETILPTQPNEALDVTLYAVGRRLIRSHGHPKCHHNNNEAPTTSLPITGSLLQSNTMIRCNSNNDWEYFFEVATITAAKTAQPRFTLDDTYRTTSETTFHVFERTVSSLFLMVPLLPPASLLTNITSIRLVKTENNCDDVDILPKIQPIQPHLLSKYPDCNNYNIRSLLYQWRGMFVNTFDVESIRMTPEQCIYHIVGNDIDHDAVHIIETVAQQLGRTCFNVAGFAAAAHLYNHNMKPSDDAVIDEYTVSTGGWIDKLHGLKCAIQDAMLLQIPTVLVLSDVDEEFTSPSSSGGDENSSSIRHIEESRIWALITDSLLSSFRIRKNEETLAVSSLPLYTPSVIVVLLTSTPLPNGPLLQNLMYETITFELPDSQYIEYVWTQRRALSSTPFLEMPESTNALAKIRDNGKSYGDQMSSVLNRVPISTVQRLMKGRPVQEILNIREEFILACLAQTNDTKHTPSDESTGAAQLLETVCMDKDKARRTKSSMIERISAVRWTDVGGLDHVRDEIRNTIELPLQYPQLFASPQGHRQHRHSGILLYGPPGTGKTFVAKAVATEYGLPFLSVKGPELLGSYVGESEAHVRAIFQRAQQLAHDNQAPRACVLFFDELDSLAPRRGDHSGSGGNVMDRVVASLLIELDKEPVNNAVVFCIGATNRPDMLDPSLLRPGRFDRLVYLGVSAADRVSILTTHLVKLRLDADAAVIAEKLVEHLPSNLTAADISTIASGALMKATERLCDAADRELVKRQRLSGLDTTGDYFQDTSIDDVLTSWNVDQLEPVVTYNDLVEVAAQIVPSVNATELEKYEQLHEMYKMRQ